MESGLRAESVDLIPPPKQHNKTAGFRPEFHSSPHPDTQEEGLRWVSLWACSSLQPWQEEAGPAGKTLETF